MLFSFPLRLWQRGKELIKYINTQKGCTEKWCRFILHGAQRLNKNQWVEALQREIQASDKKEFPDYKGSRTSTIIGGFEKKVGQSIVWDDLRIPVLGKQVD